MLNVKAVQENVSKEFLNWARKLKIDRYAYANFVYTYTEDLNLTCSARELQTPQNATQLANCIGRNLQCGNKYIQVSVTNTTKIPLLKKFGFKKVTDYMGNHGKRVHIYYINLEGFTF